MSDEMQADPVHVMSADAGTEIPRALAGPLSSFVTPTMCPVAPELVPRLREGWTTRGRVRIWLDADNVLTVQELPDDEAAG